MQQMWPHRVTGLDEAIDDPQRRAALAALQTMVATARTLPGGVAALVAHYPPRSSQDRALSVDKSDRQQI
jgi:hypothetical protein